MKMHMSNIKSSEQAYRVASWNKELDQTSRNIMKQCELLLSIYILKSCANEDQAMSVSEIAEQLNALIPDADPNNTFFPERTLRRKFDILSMLESADHNVLDQIFQLFSFVYWIQALHYIFPH